MDDMLRVGVISSTHGIKGEVKVYPTTDDVYWFKHLKHVTIHGKLQDEVFTITQVRFFKQFAILKFREINSIEEAEKYKGEDLWIARDEAMPLEDGEFFIIDLIGLSVVTDEGEVLGRIKDVLQTGANDVYVVDLPSGKELLLPAIKQCILDTDLEKQQMIIHVMDGLLDL